MFTKNGITSLHNTYVWADENSHATIVRIINISSNRLIFGQEPLTIF